MPKYRKKPVVIDASQWFKDGDHPMVKNGRGPHEWPSGSIAMPDGGVKLGFIETLEGGHIVTPGDWIICGVAGEFYPCKPDIFAAIYEPVSPELPPSDAFESGNFSPTQEMGMDRVVTWMMGTSKAFELDGGKPLTEAEAQYLADGLYIIVSECLVRLRVDVTEGKFAKGDVVALMEHPVTGEVIWVDSSSLGILSGEGEFHVGDRLIGPKGIGLIAEILGEA